MPIHSRLGRAVEPFGRVLFFGRAHECPLCGASIRRFLPNRSRADARCPSCGSLERHRLSWLYLRTCGSLGRVLHVAPERQIRRRLRAKARTYVTVDLGRKADVRASITSLPFPPEFFDTIYCSHVLEHVVEDRTAMRELCRVLAPRGLALVLVPITVERTFEDPTVTDPAERERLFGQHDHVRRYGHDYVDRLEEAGFSVSRLDAPDLTDDAKRHGVGTAEAGSIFVCTKWHAHPTAAIYV